MIAHHSTRFANSGQLVTHKAAAKMLGCSIRTVRNYADQGRLESVPTLGGKSRISLASVQKAAGIINHCQNTAR